MNIKNSMPFYCRVIFWICLAHSWLMLSTMILVNIEGCSHDQTVNHIDQYFNAMFQREDFKALRNAETEEYLLFKEGYDKSLADEIYWRMRKEFNEPAKVYIFLLSAFTTVGNFGIYPQTWGGRLFYILALPIGLLLYGLMLHCIAVELFEVFIYAAVSIFPKKNAMWTIDQRELYEKVKMCSLIFLIMIILILIVSLVSLLCNETYLTGLYTTINFVFTVDSPQNFISFDHIDRNVLALILTFLYFLVLLFVYLIFYCVFILFQYNSLSDIIRLFGKDMHDDLNDIHSVDDMLDDNDNIDHKEVIYFNAKEQMKNYDIKTILTPRIDLDDKFRSTEPPQAFDVPLDAILDSSSSDSDKSLVVPDHRKKRRKKLTLKIKDDKEEDNDDEEKEKIDGHLPKIEITQSSPVSRTSSRMSSPMSVISMTPSLKDDDSTR